MARSVPLIVPDDEGDFYYQVIPHFGMSQVGFVVRKYDSDTGELVESDRAAEFTRFKKREYPVG